MALKTVQRITFSLPKTTILKLEMIIPKNKRSKFVAQLLEKNLQQKETVTLKEVHAYWSDLAKNFKNPSKKTAVQWQREDRLSH